jgi:hypothetical protein
LLPYVRVFVQAMISSGRMHSHHCNDLVRLNKLRSAQYYSVHFTTCCLQFLVQQIAFADTLFSLDIAWQARELARKEREAIKASLTKTMGGGKFEAPAPREPRERREPRGDREPRQ